MKFPIWAFAWLFLTKMACSPKISRARATQLSDSIPPQLIRNLSPEFGIWATDGVSASRIEEMVVLTPDGVKIISLYPAEELPVANRY